MARLVGVDLPNKRIVIALTYIYGIGLTTSKKILAEAGIDESLRANDIDDAQLTKLRDILTELKLEGDLRRETAMNIKRLTEINCYRGTRHRRNLPLRGQRTKTNSRTRRKGKKTAIAGKKKATKK